MSSITPAPVFQPPQMDLPPYVLLEVFEYLPGQDLVVATHTCRLWNQLIMTRRRLRANAFIPSAYVPEYPVADTELHPVISQLHFDDSVDPDEVTYGFHKPFRQIKEAPVSMQLATCPAVTELRLDVMKYHPHLVIKNPKGVKVLDVVRELAKYKSALTNFTYDDFFGREICSKKGYERRKQMRRAGMVGSEKVLVTFAPAVQFNGTALFQALRFKNAEPARSGGAGRSCGSAGLKQGGYRFWSAFAFET